MKNISAVFTIVKEKNCPLYQVDERLCLSDKTLSCPKGKEMCLILVRDLTELLFKFLKEQPLDWQSYADTVFNCSGCTGLIKFSLLAKDEPVTEETADSNGGGAVAKVGGTVLEQYGNILDCPLLQAVGAEQLENVLGHFREIQLEEGVILINKGEKNLNLYLVLEGELVVQNCGVNLASLTEGEICGEMSYLGADVAVSTVRASRKTRLLAMGGDIFGSLLGTNRAVQGYMAQLLATRLMKTNAERARDFESCMSGRIDEIVPAELFQIFHMHQKTGVLSLDMPKGVGKISFREGCIINASYCQWTNQEAIFRVLGATNGFYRFTTGLSPAEMKVAEIGDFMKLLMEGVKRVDEEQDRE